MTFLFRMALGTAAALFFASTAGFAQDCPSKPIATVQMTLQGGEVLVPVRVNGTDETFLLDTGAGASALRDNVVETLGLPRAPIALNQVSDVGGRSFSQAAAVDSLELGDIKLDKLPLLIAPRAASAAIGDAGIIGADLLHRYDVDLNFLKRTVTFFEAEHCLPPAAFDNERIASTALRMAPGWHLFLPMTLDGKNVEGMIDTGAAVSVLTLDAFHRRFGLSKDSDGVRLAGYISGAERSRIEAYRYGFQQLSINGITLDTPTIALIPDETRRVHTVADFGSPNVGLPDLILGMSELACLHLYINYADSVIYMAKP